MPKMSGYNLEDGVTNSGDTSRAYDKYGKRHWVATPKKDMSMQDKTFAGYTEGKSAPKGADGDTPRTRTF